MFARVQEDPAIASAVLISAKPDCFIAGAEITELDACTTAEAGEAISKAGQEFFDKARPTKTQ